MKLNLYILHQYGAPRHFESLYYMNDQNEKFDKIISTEFTFARQLINSIRRKDRELFKRALKNFYYFFFFLFTKNKSIVIGAAPYDIFIVYLSILSKRHKVIYYSSWPYWDKTNYPNKVFFKWQFKLWEKFLNNAKIVGVTNKVKTELEQYSNDITVIPHCINPNVFNSISKLKEKNKVKILYVGRIVEAKGISLILDLIRSNSVQGNVEWLFVGKGEMSDEITSLQKENSSIKFLGQVNTQTELAEIYKKCDILLLPSIPNKKWEELFGIVLIEAMACGVVPISSKCVGPQTIITNGYDGYLFDINNPGKMKEIINSLIKDKAKFISLAKNAECTVKEKYTVEVNSKLWEKVFSTNN
ncbi:glycosyltransferase family 4 protein [Niallia circulans]|uniref:glycosyltransferase family 4 protein n=1 Tax=Niallia circulans TaxID=1397 RepID=UPI003513811C